VVGLALLAVLGRWILWQRLPPADFVWIQPDKLAQELQPGAWTRLKFRILRLPGPFWKWYMNNREQLLLNARLARLTTEAGKQAAPVSQCQTNREGVRAWILSADEFKSFQQRLKGLPGVDTGDAVSLTTFDGGQAQVSNGSPRTVGTNSLFIGLTLGVLPKIAGSKFDLLVSAASTGAAPLPDGTIARAMTNLLTACRVRLPNGGALVVDGGATRFSPGTNEWMILSAVAVDARGMPKKLRHEP
jgi:hypothetical protein